MSYVASCQYKEGQSENVSQVLVCTGRSGGTPRHKVTPCTVTRGSRLLSSPSSVDLDSKETYLDRYFFNCGWLNPVELKMQMVGPFQILPTLDSWLSHISHAVLQAKNNAKEQDLLSIAARAEGNQLYIQLTDGLPPVSYLPPASPLTFILYVLPSIC
jgi:hypothetical protein